MKSLRGGEEAYRKALKIRHSYCPGDNASGFKKPQPEGKSKHRVLSESEAVEEQVYRSQLIRSHGYTLDEYAEISKCSVEPGKLIEKKYRGRSHG